MYLTVHCEFFDDDGGEINFQQITAYVVSFTLVHKTEVIKTNLNPTWRPFTVPVRALCNGDLYRYVKICTVEVFLVMTDYLQVNWFCIYRKIYCSDTNEN